MLIPLWFAVMLGLGDLLEIRIPSEWISYVAICIALLLNKCFMRTAGAQAVAGS